MWAELRILNTGAGPLSDALLAQAYSAALRLGHRERLNTIDADDQYKLIRSLGIKPDYYLITNYHRGTHERIVKGYREAGMAGGNCEHVTVDGKPVIAPPPIPR